MQNTVLLSTAFAEDIIQFTVFFSGPQGVFPECQRFFVGKSIPGRLLFLFLLFNCKTKFQCSESRLEASFANVSPALTNAKMAAGD